jgi:hypothetical protein
MLQLFHPSVAKVDLDVGLLRYRESYRGSHGGVDVVRRRRSRGAGVEEAGSYPSSVEEAGDAPVWKRWGQIIGWRGK